MAAAHHLNDRVDLLDPVEFPVTGEGRVIEIGNLAPPRRVAFRRLEAAGGAPVEEVSVGVQRVTFFTIRYRRWDDFYQLITTTVASLDQVYPITQNAKFVRLEYIDRFHSIPSGADHFEVISRDSRLLVPAVKTKAAALHVHSGWFDFESPAIRMLTNVNIDVNDIAIPPPPDPRRTLSVLSLGQFEALENVLDRPVERLGKLHEYLKETFKSIITAEAAARVGLND